MRVLNTRVAADIICELTRASPPVFNTLSARSKFYLSITWQQWLDLVAMSRPKEEKGLGFHSFPPVCLSPGRLAKQSEERWLPARLFAHLARFNPTVIAELHANCKLYPVVSPLFLHVSRTPKLLWTGKETSVSLREELFARREKARKIFLSTCKASFYLHFSIILWQFFLKL